MTRPRHRHRFVAATGVGCLALVMAACGARVDPYLGNTAQVAQGGAVVPGSTEAPAPSGTTGGGGVVVSPGATTGGGSNTTGHGGKNGSTNPGGGGTNQIGRASWRARV